MTELMISPKYEKVQRDTLLRNNIQKQIHNTRWSLAHSIGILLTTVICLQWQTAVPLIVFCGLSFAFLWWRHIDFLKQQSLFAGPANWITVSRFIILAYVLTFFEVLPIAIMVSLVTIAVLMDVLDGYIARRTCTQSDFGALFDMEVDSFYVLAMGLYFYFSTGFGLWLLIPGCIRYVYDIVRIVFVDEKFEPQRQSLAVFLAGFNFMLLIAALLLPSDLSLLVLLISLSVVCISFGRSFFDLFRHVLR